MLKFIGVVLINLSVALVLLYIHGKSFVVLKFTLTLYIFDDVNFAAASHAQFLPLLLFGSAQWSYGLIIFCAFPELFCWELFSP